jgi:hypothetical protein
MLRTIGAVVTGAALWLVFASLMDRAMRMGWPDYNTVHEAMTFTLPMMIARLAESTAALVIASWIATKIAPDSRAAPWALAIVMLAPFAPYHLLVIWAKFPIWYHAYFLTSLLVLPPLTARLTQSRDAAT